MFMRTWAGESDFAAGLRPSGSPAEEVHTVQPRPQHCSCRSLGVQRPSTLDSLTVAVNRCGIRQSISWSSSSYCFAAHRIASGGILSHRIAACLYQSVASYLTELHPYSQVRTAWWPFIPVRSRRIGRSTCRLGGTLWL